MSTLKDCFCVYWKRHHWFAQCFIVRVRPWSNFLAPGGISALTMFQWSVCQMQARRGFQQTFEEGFRALAIAKHSDVKISAVHAAQSPVYRRWRFNITGVPEMSLGGCVETLSSHFRKRSNCNPVAVLRQAGTVIYAHLLVQRCRAAQGDVSREAEDDLVWFGRGRSGRELGNVFLTGIKICLNWRNWADQKLFDMPVLMPKR